MIEGLKNIIIWLCSVNIIQLILQPNNCIKSPHKTLANQKSGKQDKTAEICKPVDCST